ncbi:MAG: aminopeptidase P family protein, partial [Silvanigrellales bacterium]|nr:aminopeptidase P family protein [Silvanigrellales bacterium]
VEQPGGVAVFAPFAARERSVLFLPARDAQTEIWNGPMTPPEDAALAYGFDAAYPLSELEAKLPEILKGASCVYGGPGGTLAASREVDAGLRNARLRQKGVEWRENTVLLGELRLVKSAWELEQMRAACRLGSRMHERAMAVGRPGSHEYTLQAALEEFARSRGSLWMGYPSIVAAGENATCLHYAVNNCRVDDGDLVLIDAGCEWNGFTSDITRTFPANGRFTQVQKALYEVVLRSQKAAIALARPGATLEQLSEASTEILVDGLLTLGLLKGDPQVLVEEKKYKEFYPHGLSHWLGLDVHDVGAYDVAGARRPLEPGMAFTVEPGLYVQPGNTDVDAKWRGLGIRIEDNIVITAQGHENLVDCVKELEAVEAACQ